MSRIEGYNPTTIYVPQERGEYLVKVYVGQDGNCVFRWLDNEECAHPWDYLKINWGYQEIKCTKCNKEL